MVEPSTTVVCVTEVVIVTGSSGTDATLSTEDVVEEELDICNGIEFDDPRVCDAVSLPEDAIHTCWHLAVENVEGTVSQNRSPSDPITANPFCNAFPCSTKLIKSAPACALIENAWIWNTI